MDGYAAAGADLAMRQSPSHAGINQDNAVARSFFAALTNERVSRTVYPTQQHARADITRYIEFWYNPRRRQSSAYKSPQEALYDWSEQQMAA